MYQPGLTSTTERKGLERAYWPIACLSDIKSAFAPRSKVPSRAEEYTVKGLGWNRAVGGFGRGSHAAEHEHINTCLDSSIDNDPAHVYLSRPICLVDTLDVVSDGLT